MLNVNALGLPFKPTLCRHPAPVMDGCVLYLDGRYGGNDPATQTWYDLSGNGNDGALTNFAYNHIFSGWTGQGLAFDGVDDYVTTNVATVTENLTMGFWMNVKASSSNHSFLLTNRTTATNNSVSLLLLNNEIVHFDFGGVRWNTNYAPPKEQWVHLCLVRTASGIKLYVNGRLHLSTANAGDLIAAQTGNVFIIGQSENTNFFTGSMRDIAIYNRALSDREITQNYLATKCIMPLRHIDNAVTPAELLQNEIAAKNSPLFHDHYNTAGAEWTAAPLTQMVRLGTTANKTAGSDFDSIYPWSEMKLCNVNDDGEITAYIGDSGFKRDGTNGQVMVKIPKFYYRHVYGEAAKKHQFWISDHSISGFKLHPAFIRAGVEKPYVLLGAYKASFGRNQANTADTLASVSGVLPAVSRNIAQFRTLAEARGTETETGANWTQADALTRNAVALLYLVEYAYTNSQAAIGAGVTNSTNAIASGGCDDLKGASGNADGDVGKVSVSYRGLEDLWGNVWEFVDGINIKNSEKQPYVADNGFKSNKFVEPYKPSGITLPSGNGYVRDFACSGDADWLLMPHAVGGSNSSTYIPDYFYQNWGNSADKVAMVGGAGSGGGGAGLFLWHVYNDSSYAALAVGGRLLLIP